MNERTAGQGTGKSAIRLKNDQKSYHTHALYNAARKPAPALEVRGIHPKVFFSLYVYHNGFKSLTIQRYNRV